MSFNPFMQLMGTSSAEDEEPGPSSALLTTLRLPLDIEETETAYDITASVPGFNQDNINVTFCPDTHLLTMSGSIESKTPAAEEKVKGKEGKDKEVPVKRTQQQQKASFSRSIRLPARVNAEGIKAIVKNGLLTVSIPKPPAPEPAKTMAIKIEGA